MNGFKFGGICTSKKINLIIIFVLQNLLLNTIYVLIRLTLIIKISIAVVEKSKVAYEEERDTSIDQIILQ